MKLLIVIVLIFTVILLVLNIHATRLVLLSEIHNRFQKTAQILFIWLIPFIGAILTKQVHRPKFIEPKESWADGNNWGDGANQGIHFHD